jgi:hypothetical protein
MAIMGMLVLCPTLPGQIPPEKPVLMKIRVEEGKITADITEVPLHTVLKELAERTGIIFEVRSQDNPPVWIHLSEIPAEEAIQRIASKSNVILVYGKGAESGRITMARIFPRMAPTTQPGISYLGTGAITKTNNTVETPDQALQILQKNASIEDRQTAIEVLVKSKSEAGMKALMNCLSDPAPQIRIAAIEGLAQMGAHAALLEIVKSLKDAHPGVRQSATTAVSLLGDSANLKDLRPLRFDKDGAVAAAAEIAIRKLSTGPPK